MELSEKQVKEVAENLDCGMVCYIHKETKEIKSLIDIENEWDDNAELWEAEIKEVQENIDQYVKIEKMSSNEEFRIMERFMHQVTDEGIKDKLIEALNRRKPFRNFRNVVDYYEDYREQWFRFKEKEYCEWVRYELRDDEMEEDDTIRYFDDDGTEYNPDLYPLPSLCVGCKKKDDPAEKIACDLNRLDQLGEKEFKCGAYESINE